MKPLNSPSKGQVKDGFPICLPSFEQQEPVPDTELAGTVSLALPDFETVRNKIFYNNMN